MFQHDCTPGASLKSKMHATNKTMRAEAIALLKELDAQVFGRSIDRAAQSIVETKHAPHEVVKQLSPPVAGWRRRRLAKSISLNTPQFFDVKLPASGLLAGQPLDAVLNLKLMLTNVVPQFRSSRVILIFAYHWPTLADELGGKIPSHSGRCAPVKTPCFDIGAHIDRNTFGSLRCEFVSTADTTMIQTNITVTFARVEPQLGSIVTQCALPMGVDAVKLRVLRSHDGGAPEGTNIFEFSGMFEPSHNVLCPPKVLHECNRSASTLPECAACCSKQSCGYFTVRRHGGCKICAQPFAQCARTAAVVGDGDGSRGRSRVARQRAWDLHPLEIDQTGNHLLTIGGTKPLYGDAYIARVPEWLEYVCHCDAFVQLGIHFCHTLCKVPCTDVSTCLFHSVL